MARIDKRSRAQAPSSLQRDAADRMEHAVARTARLQLRFVGRSCVQLHPRVEGPLRRLNGGPQRARWRKAWVQVRQCLGLPRGELTPMRSHKDARLHVVGSASAEDGVI
jgi:hypothetical protein